MNTNAAGQPGLAWPCNSPKKGVFKYQIWKPSQAFSFFLFLFLAAHCFQFLHFPTQRSNSESETKSETESETASETESEIESETESETES